MHFNIYQFLSFLDMFLYVRYQLAAVLLKNKRMLFVDIGGELLMWLFTSKIGLLVADVLRSPI